MAEPGYLTLKAGPAARAALADGALTPDRIGAVAGAAGGLKFLVLSALDQYLFGDWLPRAEHTLALVGSSIGAWRFAAACAPDPVAALQTLESAYIEQHYSARPETARTPDRAACPSAATSTVMPATTPRASVHGSRRWMPVAICVMHSLIW